MPCAQTNYDSYTIADCVITFEGNGEIKELDLSSLTISTSGVGNLRLCDSKMMPIYLADDDIVNIGGIDRATFIAELKAARAACNGSAAPVSIPLSDSNEFFVCDANDTSMPFLVEVTYDEATETRTYQKTDGTPVVEGVDFVMCPEQSTAEIRHKCFVDDVDGNGLNLVPYVQAYSVKVNAAGDGIETTDLGLFEDECFDTPYMLQGLPDIVPAQFNLGNMSGRIIINDTQTWSPPANVKSFTLRVRGTANGSTYTDSYGRTTPLDDNETVTYGFNNMSDSIPVVDPNNGAQIVITYTIK